MHTPVIQTYASRQIWTCAGLPAWFNHSECSHTTAFLPLFPSIKGLDLRQHGQTCLINFAYTLHSVQYFRKFTTDKHKKLINTKWKWQTIKYLNTENNGIFIYKEYTHSFIFCVDFCTFPQAAWILFTCHQNKNMRILNLLTCAVWNGPDT